MSSLTAFKLLMMVSFVLLVPNADIPTTDLARPLKFVDDTYVQTAGDGGYLQECLIVLPEKLWNQGDNAGMLDDQINNSTVIAVDHKVMPSSAIRAMNDLSREPVFQDRALVGSYGGPIELCFTMSTLSPGPHAGTIWVTETNQQRYYETWTFKT